MELDSRWSAWPGFVPERFEAAECVSPVSNRGPRPSLMNAIARSIQPVFLLLSAFELASAGDGASDQSQFSSAG